MPLDDDRPYWQRHYGLPRGPVDRRSVRRLGLALVAALLFILLVVALAAAVQALL